MHCRHCYFHTDHATPYQCELQQLVSKGLIRLIEHPTTMEIRTYKRTSYRQEDAYSFRCIVPRISVPAETVGPFAIVNLTMDPVLLKTLQIRGKMLDQNQCQVVISKLAYHTV